MEENEILRYGVAVGKAYEGFLKRVENGYIIFSNEWEMKYQLFAEYVKYLEEKGFPKPYHAWIECKVNDSVVDFALPIDKRVIAVEVKYNPSLPGIEKDLAKLRELLDKNLIFRGIFITLALSDYGLKERLRVVGAFSRFELKEEGIGDSGSVEWRTFRRAYARELNLPELIDALLIVLWKTTKPHC